MSVVITRASHFFHEGVDTAGSSIQSSSPHAAHRSRSAAPSVAGPSGTTIGWGYRITNPSATLWLELTALSADPVAHATLDLFIFDFPILAPLQTVDAPYDAVSQFGLAELIWDATAPLGFANAGAFQLEGVFYDDDPLGAGVFVMDATAQVASYTATAQQKPAVAPEPGTLLSLAAGTLAFAIRQRMRRS